MASDTFRRTIDEIYTKKEVWGIYAYADVETGAVMYIGIDRHIDRDERHKDHMKPSKADKDAPRHQAISAYLIDNPGKLEYIILVPYIIDPELAMLIERECINYFNPVLNVKKKDK